MIGIEQYDDVMRLHMSSWRSRAAGYSVSAYLVRGVLVDTGFAGAAEALDRWLRNTRRAWLHGVPAGLTSAIVTHAHEDHSGNAGLLQERGVPVWLSAATRAAMRDMRSVPLYRRLVWSNPRPLASPEGQAANAAVPLPPGIEVLPAPGHSPDHHVVWDNETRTLFGGDLFLGVRVRVAHHSESPRTLVATLRRLAALEPLRLFDAHRGAVERPAAALRTKADWLEELIDTIQERSRTVPSARRIRDDILGREPVEYYVSFNEYSKLQLVEAVLDGR